MLHRDSDSGAIDDLAHVVSAQCLSDALTNHSAKADELIRAVESGTLRLVDVHPPFRTLIKHKAYLMTWLKQFLNPRPSTTNKTRKKNEDRGFYDFKQIETFFAEEVTDEIYMAHCQAVSVASSTHTACACSGISKHFLK